MTEEQRVEEISWNLAQAIILEIGNRLNNASECFVNSKLGNALLNLKAVRLRIASSLTDKERSELLKLETDIGIALNKYKPGGFNKPSQESKHMQAKAHFYYDKYNTLLMKCLKKYGYFIPAKEDVSVMTA